MKISKKLKVYIDFSSKFLIKFASFGGSGVPTNPIKCILLNFSKILAKFSWKNSSKFSKIFKHSQYFL